MRDEFREQIADQLTEVLNEASAANASVLRTRLSRIQSTAMANDAFTEDSYVAGKLKVACEAIERCFGPRNSRDSFRRDDALNQIHRVRCS